MESVKDAIDKLRRGNATKSKIGSQSVPHRLNNREHKLFEIAKKRGYLAIKSGYRDAIINTWSDYCILSESPIIIHIKDAPKDTLIIRNMSDELRSKLDRPKVKSELKIKKSREEIKNIVKKIL
jgi:hypothetical protein